MVDAVDRAGTARVLVVGDLMLDRYYFGEARRISPEAPVPVVRVLREEECLGGAANVVNNLLALGCQVEVIGLAAEDAAGGRLRALLSQQGVGLAGVLSELGRPTTEKLRILATHQQLLRTDWEHDGPLQEATLQALCALLPEALEKCDGVIVSDYGKGLITPGLMDALRRAALQADKPVLVDPKGTDWAKFHGVTCLTPNEHETAAVTRRPAASDAEALAAGRALQAELGLPMLCVTRGPHGVLALLGEESRYLPTEAREVFDVTGAGDTFISVFGAALFAGLPFYDAVALGNQAAGIVVSKVGSATVSPAELRHSSEGLAHKLLSREAAGRAAAEERARGRRVVFTNGCFDLIHAGHIQYLQESRRLGDALFIGLNSDASVKRLKGPERPLIDEHDRAHLLAALACVDHVVIFDEDTPLELIRAIRPDVLTKGADYTVETVVGNDLLAEWNGKVELISLKPNRSTSGLIEQIRGKPTS